MTQIDKGKEEGRKKKKGAKIQQDTFNIEKNNRNDEGKKRLENSSFAEMSNSCKVERAKENKRQFRQIFGCKD